VRFDQGPVSVGKVVASIGFGRQHGEQFPRDHHLTTTRDDTL
jgi:hypothetical protein